MARILLALAVLSLSSCLNQKTREERWREGVEELRNRDVSDEVDRRAAGLPVHYSASGRAAYEPAALRVRNAVRSERVVVGGTDPGLYIFDVSDLIHGVRDFPGPTIADLRLPEDRPDYGERGPGERVPFVNEDDLIELVRTALASGTVDEEDVSVTISNG